MPGLDSAVLFLRAGAGLNRRQVRNFARRLSAGVAGGRPFECLITDDGELRRLNRSFLGRDYATDVLAFPSAEPGSSLGQIAVSADRAAAQARQFGHTLEEEIGILMLHGLLHLLGMDHRRDGGRMAREERRWRRELGLPGGLIERARR